MHRIVGTAGHIDHGKTALVKALTGVDTDRLKEEQERGITIDLGFARLDLGDGLVAGVVDVPGHERFVRNMLAGAGGIDTVLLVVSADESIKPQTVEHFQICRLLGVRSGVVALTKCDLVQDDLLELVRDEVRDLTAGTFLENAPVVPVSSRTGAGLTELRQALGKTLRSTVSPARADFARLPVDRVFTAHGFGAVVTGTLVSGRIAVGDELALWPTGGSFRVRRVEVHGVDAPAAESGQRTALNVAGTERDRLRRGTLLSTPGRLLASSLLDVRLEVLPGLRKPVPVGMAVRFHGGTADVAARLRLLSPAGEIPPGKSGLVQIRLSEPLAAAPGDRFIVRRPTPALTLAGGVVLDPLPAKHRAADADALRRLEAMEGAALPARLRLLLDEAGESGESLHRLVVRGGASSEDVQQALSDAPGEDALLRDGGGQVLGSGAHALLRRRVLELLSGFHRQNPLEEGMPLQELRRRAGPNTPASLMDALLHSAVEKGEIRLSGRAAALAAHRVALDPEDSRRLEACAAAVRQGGLDPEPAVAQLVAQGFPEERAGDLARLLATRGILVRIADGLVIHRDTLDELKEKLWQRRETLPEIDVAAFKEITCTSRRTAIPLLEFLDAERVTVRRGNVRVIQPRPRQAGDS